MEEHSAIRAKNDRKSMQAAIVVLLVIVCGLANLAYLFMEKYAPTLSRDVFGFYQEYVFPVLSTPFAFFTDKVPFSLGEILIIIGLCCVPLSIIIGIVTAIVKKNDSEAKKKVGKVIGLFYAWVFVYVLFTETFNCFLLYHAPTFAELYGYPQDKYTAAQLEQLADFLITRSNDLAMQVKRDENGQFVLTADLDKTAKTSLKALKKEYPLLGGYYTTPKKVKNSFFMSQQYLMGIYFPFTMEANYNTEMYALNMPDTVCHELAHTKGFIREDEANFISFLACEGSDNTDYRYSGYVRALKYVMSKCDENCSEDVKNRLYSRISDGVRADWNGNSEYWKSVQESDKGLLDSKKVAEASDKAMEASLKINGVEDGKKSYGRMVDLLLDWYFMEQE
ncbi:Protein of unknown function [Ruminococcus sp. YE71]|uniref:DUF3810 domain-containing protein n=1 Tax=unclassified Ruminococcus TaxID=2608920 RepID=UPI000883A9BA|nr:MULTISPECIES: DUF3810 domain-containing protein [unclassified Ruminococcus]SDA12421.1 Protein of unknown function [Ruminococcus sp. YE78]SFW16867.1 Protein of unknown function [Ruminococcus sp. YE71]